MSKKSTYRATIQEQGRVAIPKSVREALELEAGAEIDVTVEKVGEKQG